MKGKPDYVHVHVAMNAGVAAKWIREKWNIPYFVTEHWVGYYRECVPSLFDNSKLFRFLNKRILEEAALFFPVTKDLGETVKKNWTDIPYRVIPNVVNTQYFTYKKYAPVKFRFIHISYMTFQKNPEGMFIAAKMLKDRGYDFELFMLGNKNESLTRLAERYGLLPQTVIFNDAVPYKEVANFIQNASAFLLFSRFENLPCVLLEALCCGLPVISTRVGGIAEVVNKDNGILVESENNSALTDAMQNMIDNYASYNRGKISADASLKFNYEQVGGQIAGFYE
jgi:glycosyltransferase involved in cell wall biosynthesis